MRPELSTDDSFHLVYSGDSGVSLRRDSVLVHSSKMPALVGDHVTFCPGHGKLYIFYGRVSRSPLVVLLMMLLICGGGRVPSCS